MHHRNLIRRTGGTITSVLVLGTLAVGFGAPTAGANAPEKAPSIAKDLQQDRRDLTQLTDDVARLNSELKVTMAAAAPPKGIVAPSADEVSAAIAALFGSYAQEYQALGAQATAFHNEFVQLVSKGGSQAASAEAAAVAPYVAWLETTAQQDEKAAAQATAAANQFEHQPNG
jgi:hypothetical protein